MSTIDWTPVEEAETENTLTGYKIALLEAAKLLDQRLAEEKVPGKNSHERLQSARWHLTHPDKVDQSMNYVEGLRNGQTGGLTKTRAKDYLQNLRQAVADLNDLAQTRTSRLVQIKLLVGLLQGKKGWVLRILLGIGASFLLVLFLADTFIGRALVSLVVGTVHLFFGLIVGFLLLIGLIVLIVVATAIFLDHRTGGRVKAEDE